MSNTVRSEMVFVTPELAKTFLSRNEENRRVRNGWVNYLAFTIKNGEWIQTHQGIAFSESGRLLDGQHRLLVIIKANIPVHVMVTHGLDDKAFSAIDNGMKRTNQDLTRLPKHIVEPVRFFHLLMNAEGGKTPTGSNGSSKMSPSLINFYASIVGDFCGIIYKNAPTKARVFSSVPVFSAAVCAIMRGESFDYVLDTYRNLVLGKTEAFTPILHSAFRQVTSGRFVIKAGGEGQIDTFVRFNSVFKEENKNWTKLIARDRDLVIKEVRQALKPWFFPDENSKRDQLKKVFMGEIRRCIE